MSLRKDKKKVIGEDMTDEQVAVFINYQPINNGEDAPDFLILQNAYRSLRTHDFERFLKGFLAKGGDLNAQDRYGKKISDYIKTHRYGDDYLVILQSA